MKIIILNQEQFFEMVLVHVTLGFVLKEANIDLEFTDAISHTLVKIEDAMVAYINAHPEVLKEYEKRYYL